MKHHPVESFWNLHNKSGKAASTRFGSVHFGKKGVHIVPANPFQYK